MILSSRPASGICNRWAVVPVPRILRLQWGVATGAGVIVAVIDGGYRPHADLNPNMLAGYDFISADPDGSFTTANDANGRDSDATDPGDWSAQGDCAPANSSWHGTHVAGIIAAVTNNNAGVAGAAFNARLLPVRVLGVCGGYVSDIAAGMRWAAGLPVPGVPANTQIAKVLNLSLGRQGNCSPTFGCGDRGACGRQCGRCRQR